MSEVENHQNSVESPISMKFSNWIFLYSKYCCVFTNSVQNRSWNSCKM